MENIKFTRLENKLVLLTFNIGSITLKFSGLEAIIPVWYSVDEDISMPFNPEIQNAYKAWRHNQEHAAILAPFKKCA